MLLGVQEQTEEQEPSQPVLGQPPLWRLLLQLRQPPLGLPTEGLECWHSRHRSFLTGIEPVAPCAVSVRPVRPNGYRHQSAQEPATRLREQILQGWGAPQSPLLLQPLLL